MRALRIDWWESEAGWGQSPDGCSLHKTPEAAVAYLQAVQARLPENLPREYDFPSDGWRKPAIATPVEIPEDSLIGQELKESDSTRVFRTFNGHLGDLYKEAGRLEVAGEAVSIDYGHTPYSPAEEAHIAGMRAVVEHEVRQIQMAAGLTPDI
jgi:hypothetical protein